VNYNPKYVRFSLECKGILPYNDFILVPSWRFQMTTLTVTAKGQITLRQDLLKHLGIEPGQKVEVEKLPDGRIIAKAASNGTMLDFFGCLAQPAGPILSINEMNQITTDGWANSQ
jgi:bifunctional DNA-binding transcriptional regulator/antitoxin component of YhaV-PrlF toxin-antitoxin module